MSAVVIKLAIPGYTMRAWRSSDAGDLYQALSYPTVGEYLADWYPKDGYTQAMAEEWVSGGADVGGINWAITFNDVAIGSAGVHQQTGFARCNVEIGYWLAHAHWGKSVGTSVVATLTRRAFESPEVTRVFAPIHAGNLRSQRVCEKNGFEREGLLRQSTMKWGEAIDVVLWAAYRKH